MGKEIERIENKRVHDRFVVKKGGMAFLGKIIVTDIIDISEGGMAVRFVVLGKEPDGCFSLDIFYADDKFYLKDLSVELVNIMDLPSSSSFSNILVKRAGIRFRRLNDKQKNRLKYFIDTMTIGVC